MFAVRSLWEGQLLWRGELNDDGYLWFPFDLVDEFRNSLIIEDGAQPVFEGRVIDLAVVLNYMGGCQDHDPLGIVWGLVWWTSLAHGV